MIFVVFALIFMHWDAVGWWALPGDAGFDASHASKMSADTTKIRGMAFP